MALRGMDVERVDTLLGQLQIQADLIHGIVNVVDGAVAALTGVWSGENLNVFHGHWVGGQRAQAQASGADIADAIARLHSEISQQRTASGQTTSVSGGAGGSAVWAAGGIWAARFFEAKAGLANRAADGLSKLNDWVELSRGKGNDLFVGLKNAGEYRGALKALGVGAALDEFGDSYRHHDASGMMGAAADGGFTFASAPVSVLWNGLKAETGFFLPLDSQHADALYNSMISKGYTPDQLSTRWSGFSGFTQYGNDYVDSHAPWLVNASDKVMAPLGGWLYNHGIKL